MPEAPCLLYRRMPAACRICVFRTVPSQSLSRPASCWSSAGAAATAHSSTQPAPVTPAVVTVAGAAQTRIGGTAQFTATVTGGTSTAVTWQVNGVTGGSAATGTISASGLYTAPSTLPSPNTVTIAAVNAAATAPGTLVETILNPIPTVSSATATQSGTTTTYNIDVMGTGFINGAQIEIGGSPVTTNFVSSTELTAAVTVAAGTTSLAVSVVNPTSGGYSIRNRECFDCVHQRHGHGRGPAA